MYLFFINFPNTAHKCLWHTHSDDKTWFAGFLPLLCFLCDQKRHAVSLLRKLITEQWKEQVMPELRGAIEHRFKHACSPAEIYIFTQIGT